MATPIFCYHNFLDLATSLLSGGSWETTLPLANLKDRDRAKIARSTDDATGSTQFDVDLGATRLVRVVGLFSMNLSLSATVRVRGYTGAGHTSEVFDTTAVNPFVIYPSGVLEAGHPAFGGTTLAQEDLDAGYPVDWTYVLSTPVSPRYLWFTVIDTTNPDNFVEIGRPWISYGYKPSHGVDVGMRGGYETSSSRTETKGGSMYHRERARRRVWNFLLSNFEEDESMVYLFELARRIGTSEQMLAVLDPDATVHMHRYAGLYTLKDLKPLVFAHSLLNDIGFSLLEDL